MEVEPYGPLAIRAVLCTITADRCLTPRAAGGVDNGAPGLRTVYHPDYYGGYVLDPDGNNIEAVCHTSGIGVRR